MNKRMYTNRTVRENTQVCRHNEKGLEEARRPHNTSMDSVLKVKLMTFF